MKSFANLKARLEALPELRKGIEQAGLFAQFLAKIEPAKQQLIEASAAAVCSVSVLPSSEYEVAKRSVKSSARIAKNLADKLRKDGNTISDRATEESFVKLTDYSKDALKRAKSGWQSTLQAKIEKWEAIAGVVSAIGRDTPLIRAQGALLKSSVDALRLAKDKLPLSPEEVALVKEHLEQLTDAVTQLRLDTPFGKFLQAAASEQGALLSDAEEETVAQQIKTLKLAKVFRVHLSS